jgi:NifU-like protein involved in Fe-S cluster formation
MNLVDNKTINEVLAIVENNTEMLQKMLKDAIVMQITYQMFKNSHSKQVLTKSSWIYHIPVHT